MNNFGFKPKALKAEPLSSTLNPVYQLGIYSYLLGFRFPRLSKFHMLIKLLQVYEGRLFFC